MRYGWMRRLGVLVGLIALAATPALAQDESQPDKPRHERMHAEGDHRQHDPERKIEHLREALSLTEAQVAQIRTIFAEQGEKRRELLEGENREGMRALHQETHDRLVAILDETQRAKLEEMKQRHGEGRGRHGGEGEGREHQERHGAES